MEKNYYIFSKGRLKREDNTLYFINQDTGKKKYLPIEQVDNIYLFGETDLNTTFLQLLQEYDVRVHFFNYYGFYMGTFYPRSKKVSGFTVVNQCAHYLDKEKRQFIAQSFIHSAVFHMVRNLRHYKPNTASYIDGLVKLAKEIDQTHSIHPLMGIEGNIHQIYYQSFNKFLPDEFAFDTRTKRPPQDPLNALISFGNSLCYTTVLSEIYKTHLDPTVSFLHEPSTKRFSLSLDIAEIFKPLLVDSLIFKLLNKKMLKQSDFRKIDNMILLDDSGRKKFIQAWEDRLSTTVKHRKLNRQVSYRYFMRLECYKLIKHFLGDEVYRPLKAWW
ncbi:type I-B CRISPR-associated endonuclease Cas1b [Sporolactobacillus sp. THM19-2]|uniref:type I-B CRISPR-associated endonuclease Cas1b n=1 Tax=Sporolactobacillus sp. THM19-2 TaxID=2511171 RepID=UPI00101E8C50|nr:type I-B CRISPR-associated endonuclease Cas1b [Sporolactobacillus sp. THM19-2]RYL93712.1 type I-B CRISPR-associated endonuclease Cas1 [Sporolactobacillus sp. THM19-2]